MKESAAQRLPGTGERREYYSVTITSTARSGVTQFRLSRTLVRVAVAAAAVLVVMNVAGLVLFGHLLHRARSSGELIQDNHKLRSQLAQLGIMEQRLATLDSMRVAVLRVVGVDVPESVPASEQGQERGAVESAGEYRVTGPGPEPVLEDLDAIRAVLTRIPMAGPRTRGFGPLGEEGIFHTGNDIAGQTGAAVAAAGEGVVSFVGSDKVFGNVLLISHNPRLSTMYGHASRILVKVGDFVNAGEIVARAGSTGRSTAPHLHFEVLWDGRSIDPALVFKTWQDSGAPQRVDARPGNDPGDGGRATNNLGSR